MNFVRIWSRDDDGKSFIHLASSGNDYTICGHDIAGDDLVHARPCKELKGRHRVTCVQCLQIIADVKEYLDAVRTQRDRTGT